MLMAVLHGVCLVLTIYPEQIEINMPFDACRCLPLCEAVLSVTGNIEKFQVIGCAQSPELNACKRFRPLRFAI